MNNTAQTPAEEGKSLIDRLIGSTVREFGANLAGEIYLMTERDGVPLKLVVGKDDAGEITLFEIETKEVSA